jgi:hypothetical protein
MIIRADTNNEEKVPKLGDHFIVKRVEKVAAFYIIEAEREET